MTTIRENYSDCKVKRHRDYRVLRVTKENGKRGMFVPLKMRIYEIIPIIIIIIGFNRVAIEFRASESLLTGRSIIKEFNNWKISEEDCVFIYIRRGYFWIVVKVVWKLSMSHIKKNLFINS